MPSNDSDACSLELFPDWKELLALFERHGVEYAIVGGIAVGLHGYPRATKDLDVLVHCEDGNATRVLAALAAFGFGTVGLTEADFATPDRFVVLGQPPARVDLLTTLPGVDWADVEAGHIVADFDGQPVRVIGRAELIRAKRAAGRHIDLADIDGLTGDA